MDEPLDEQYLTWLYSMVASPKVTNPHRTYWSLLKHLYTREFVWIVPNDDNRVEDGRDLRHEFLEAKRLRNVDPDWLGLGCSVLELLIGISKRMSFEADGQPRKWFWILLDNLGLGNQSDGRYDSEYVEEAIERLIWRTYNPDGSGGLFPLKGPCDDQRNVEIWYQLSSYLIERGVV